MQNVCTRPIDASVSIKSSSSKNLPLPCAHRIAEMPNGTVICSNHDENTHTSHTIRLHELAKPSSLLQVSDRGLPHISISICFNLANDAAALVTEV